MGATLYAPFGSVPATRKAEGVRFTRVRNNHQATTVCASGRCDIA
jgi:hypothetical protein